MRKEVALLAIFVLLAVLMLLAGCSSYIFKDVPDDATPESLIPKEIPGFTQTAIQDGPLAMYMLVHKVVLYNKGELHIQKFDAAYHAIPSKKISAEYNTGSMTSSKVMNSYVDEWKGSDGSVGVRWNMGVWRFYVIAGNKQDLDAMMAALPMVGLKQ